MPVTTSAQSPAQAVNLDGGGAVLLKEARAAAAAPTGTDQPFAILRYAKLKSARSITGSSQHMRRTHPTPNADPSRSNSNQILVGSTNPEADAMQLIPAEGARDAEGKLLRRSNSVLAVEVLMTTSPQWWDTATPEQQDAWVEQSRAWLELEWGAENIAHLELHRDEKTPHLTGLIVPLDERGGLNARAWIGGRASKKEPGTSLISGHQTRYAAAVEDLGLRRGIIGSTAKHTTVQQHYKAIARAQELARPVPQVQTPPLFGREDWAQGTNRALRRRTTDLAHAAAELPVERQRRLAAERTAELANERAEEAKAARRALADEMRALPLDEVLVALGLEEDPRERGMFKMGPPGARTHRIAIREAKWFDHVAQRGRGGAIDLAQHVLESDFDAALSWLSANFGAAATTAEYRRKAHEAAIKRVERASRERAPFTLPAPDPAAWPEARRHLIEDRALPEDLVDAAHEAGDLYAVSRQTKGTLVLRNAVFVQRDASGAATGAELKGIVAGRDGKHWSGLAPGSSKTAGVFRTGVELTKAAAVFVAESAIDALSLAARVRDKVRSFTIISTAGDNTMPAPILAAIPEAAKRYAAQDRNDAGDRQAERLGDGWTRARPPAPHEDWNEELIARRNASRGDRGTAPQPPAPAQEVVLDPFAAASDPQPPSPDLTP